MHVISDLLGVNYLELKPTARDTAKSEDLKKLLSELRNGNAIILCDGNPALIQFYDHIIRPDTLPCWFESYKNKLDVDNKYKKGESIRIAVKETSKTDGYKIDSPSEKYCIEATDYKNKAYKPGKQIQADYGILAD
jgi:hypothetical protein